MGFQSLNDVLQEQLEDLYSAETQLIVDAAGGFFQLHFIRAGAGHRDRNAVCRVHHFGIRKLL